jgi:hypothetical protein
MINLTRVQRILDEVHDKIEELDGMELDETNALTNQTTSNVRVLKAQRSQDLQFMANRLELAAQLVRVEYWAARGFTNPIDG